MTFPSTPEQYEEYVATMNSLSDMATASAPDPQPADLQEQDDSHLDGEWFAYDDEQDDHMYGQDDQIDEYGQSGCCGDF
jgi:hypothetical protein